MLQVITTKTLIRNGGGFLMRKMYTIVIMHCGFYLARAN